MDAAFPGQCNLHCSAANAVQILTFLRTRSTALGSIHVDVLLL